MMKGFNLHRGWALLLLSGLALMAVAPPLIKIQADDAARTSKSLAADWAQLQETSRRFHDDVTLAHKQDGQIDAKTIDRLLAPVDRMQTGAALEQLAVADHLSHLSYTLQPEHKVEFDTVGAGDMAESEITFAADAPLDGNVYQFVDDMSRSLPGRVHVRRLQLARLDADKPLSQSNIHIEASALWVYNAATRRGTAEP